MKRGIIITISIIVISFIISLIPKESLSEFLKDLNGYLSIAAIITIFIFLFSNHKKELKIRNDLNKLEEDPNKKEIARITKSKLFRTPSNDSKKLIKIVIALFLFAFMLGTVILVTYIYNVNINFIIFFAVGCFFIFIGAINIGNFIIEKNNIDYICESLLNTYNDIQVLPLPLEKIVYGDKTKIGHIKNNYNISIKIPKYHCILTNYYQERLEIQRSAGAKSSDHYPSYIRLKNVFEYLYNLKPLGLPSITNNVLEHEKLKKVINEISQSKLIKVSIENDCLIIRKETVLYDYQEEDAIRDVSDVEFFYDKIIKILLDNDIEILEITNAVDSKEKEIENDYENHYNYSLLHSIFTPQNKSLFTFIICIILLIIQCFLPDKNVVYIIDILVFAIIFLINFFLSKKINIKTANFIFLLSLFIGLLITKTFDNSSIAFDINLNSWESDIRPIAIENCKQKCIFKNGNLYNSQDKNIYIKNDRYYIDYGYIYSNGNEISYQITFDDKCVIKNFKNNRIIKTGKCKKN